MPLSRRTLLQSVAALPIAATLPRWATAEVRLGSASLTTVSDGSLILPADLIFAPMPQDELAPIRAEFGLTGDQLTPECNLTLYRDGTNTVLFDVGSGSDFMSTAGTVLDSLDAAGVQPGDVTHVVFTHAHPDHIWGLLDDFDDLQFPEAAVLMGRREWDYWWDPDTVNTIGASRVPFAVGARRRMEAIQERVELFEDGDEVLPGIAAMLTPGHTPGHMSFEIRNGGDAALVVGDAIGNHHVAFRRPEWPSGTDQDPDTAIAARLRLFDRLTTEDLRLVGFHLPGGGIGRAERTTDGFRFVADAG